MYRTHAACRKQKNTRKTFIEDTDRPLFKLQHISTTQGGHAKKYPGTVFLSSSGAYTPLVPYTSAPSGMKNNRTGGDKTPKFVPQ